MREYPPVLWDTRVRPPHPPGRACRVRNVRCRPQSTYVGTLSVGVFCTRPPQPRKGVSYSHEYLPGLWDTRVRPLQPPGRACRVRHVRCRPQSTYLGTLWVGVFCTRLARPRKGVSYLREYLPVLWDTRVRPPHSPGRASRVRNVKCRPQSTYLGTLSVGVFCTRPPRPR